MSTVSLLATATSSIASAVTMTVTATASASAKPPVYFDGCWSIMSSMAILIVITGFMIGGMVGFSAFLWIPIIVSSAAALADGLLFYESRPEYSAGSKFITHIVCNIGWGIQEAGLPFYSYLLLRKILTGKQRLGFMIAFWLLTSATVAMRLSIMTVQIFITKSHNTNVYLSYVITHLHIANFTFIAATETISAIFLLKTFYKARKRMSRFNMGKNVGLFKQLSRSSEVRVATLALIGIGRANTFSAIISSKKNLVAGQVDRFISMLEVFFPIVLLIDVLSTKMMQFKGGSQYEYGSCGSDGTGGNVSTQQSQKKMSRVMVPVGMETVAGEFPGYVGMNCVIPDPEKSSEKIAPITQAVLPAGRDSI